MAEKAPCRHDMDGDGLHCAHPLHNHFYGDHPSIWTVKDGHRGLCIGCPCHEPEPAKDTTQKGDGDAVATD